MASRDNVVVHAGSGESTVWCGRAAASIIYNYFQLVNAYTEGKEEATARKRFIKNNRDLDSGRPLDLIYPNDEIACHSGNTYFALAEPLIRVTEGWKRRPLITKAEREAHNADTDPQLEVASDEIEEELQPVINSLDRNTPVLAYTGLSMNDRAPRHIVVISGYKFEDDALWLHVTDPATMRNDDADDKGRLLEPVDAQGRPPRNLIEILDEGDWAVGESGGAAARYWLKASRLFEAQQHSRDPDDVWLDHASQPGLAVWIHDTHVTPDSPYARRVVDAPDVFFPVNLDGTHTPQRATPDAVKAAYDDTERFMRGGYFPVSVNQIWHGGLHFHTPEGAPVRAPLPGCVVAARLGPGPAADSVYGSTRFVLCRHDVTDVLPPSLVEHVGNAPLYSLAMHLAPGTFTDTAAAPIPTPPWDALTPDWCRTEATSDAASDTPTLDPEQLQALARGEVASGFCVPVEAGDLLWGVGVAGQDEHRAAMVHVELFSPGERDVYSRIHEAIANAYPDFDTPARRPFFDHAAVEDPNRDGFNDDVEVIVDLLKAPSNATRGALPQAATGPGASHFEQRNLLVSNAEWGPEPALARDEVDWFYAHHPNAERLRTYACRFVGEWTRVSDIYGWFQEGDPSRFLWWDAVASDEQALSAGEAAWYYNPIRMFDLLAHLPLPQRKTPRVAQVNGPRQITPGHSASFVAQLQDDEGWESVSLRWTVQVWHEVGLGNVMEAWTTGQAIQSAAGPAILERETGSQLHWTPSPRIWEETSGAEGTLTVRVQAQTTARAESGSEPQCVGCFTQVTRTSDPLVSRPSRAVSF